MLNLFKFLLIISFFSFSLHALDKIKIFTLHSYSQEYLWTKSQHTAFVGTLLKDSSALEFEFYSEYLDTKRLNLTEKYQTDFLEYLKKKYTMSDIDIFYVTDDNALKFIHNNYNKLFKGIKKPPVFFSGINNLNMHNTLPQDTFVGVYEVKEIKENVELIKQFSPQTRDIYFVGDNSHTYASIKNSIQKEELNFKNINFHYINDASISEIQKQLPTEPRSFVLLTTIGQFKDDTGNTLLVQESINKINENKNLILLTMEDAYMHKGVVGGYVTSGFSQGKEAAKLVLQYLQNNSLKNISSLLKSPNVYTFDSKELINSRIILSNYISRDAIIIGKDIGFIDNNQAKLLSIAIIIIVVLAFGMILMYAFFSKKYKGNSQTQLENELKNIKLKLNSKDHFINNIISFGDIGYWRY
ncbi:diguanylate cyclase, partial [Sulfurimonas sp.]|nr:diguanylate cyclase [Sulfurimonas sp.]